MQQTLTETAQPLETPGAFIQDRTEEITAQGTVLPAGRFMHQLVRIPQAGIWPDARAMGLDQMQHFQVIEGRINVYLFTMFERGRPLPAVLAAEIFHRSRGEWPDATDVFTERVVLDARRPQVLTLAASVLYWVETVQPTVFLSSDDFRPGLRPAVKAALVQDWF